MSDNPKDIKEEEGINSHKAPARDAATINRLELAVRAQGVTSRANAVSGTLALDGAKKGRYKEPKVKITRRLLKKQRELILITIPFILYGLLFNYAPLAGWITAFQKYKPGKGFLKSEWVGLKNFETLFRDDVFIKVIRNTLAMGVINLVLSFAFAIGLAILLNEVKLRGPKSFAQTISYLPHFLSWIIAVGIIRDMLAIDHGIINEILVRVGLFKEPLNFFSQPKLFWWIVGFSNVWKETGWNSIIYLAAISAINPDIYEAASLDGAGRFGKIWHVTLPGIKPTIFILLLLNLGNVLNIGFELQYIMTNPLIQGVSETVDLYVMKWGISQGNFSMGTAAGIFKSVVSIVLIFLANSSAKLAGEERLF